MNESTMMEAATPTNGSQASSAPESTTATAEALYGDGQKATASKDSPAAAPATENKATDNKTEPKAEAPKVPEQYEFKAPEGREFDSEVVKNFSEVARELNLTQDAAQKILDRMGPTLASRQESQVKAIRGEWVASARSDQEFGGDKLAENMAVAKRALDKFGSPELTALLNDSRLGNHPELIRAFHRIGRAIADDTIVPGERSTNRPSDPAQRLYDKSNLA
jgi:hypothetical protein